MIAFRLIAARFGLLSILPLFVLAPAQADWFADVTESAGVDFTYHNGMSGEYYFPEIMGAGVAVLDYNGNGLLDIYLVQGGALGPDVGPAERERGDRLYRNESYRDDDGEWVLKFVDATDEAGIDARGYGMGVAVGDYTGNGYPDLYVLNFGPNELWRNNGDGSFSDATEAAGVGEARWSVSASFADLDGDGHLDLVVANYVDFDFDSHQECRSSATGQRDYCSPSAYSGITDTLYLNNGDGSFTDATDSTGLAGVARHGLGVITADFNGDGRLEIYVANDGSANSHWLRDDEGNWIDDAYLAGNAVNVDGAMEAGMGVDAADYNHSGAEDIFITHMRRETNTLYRNDGQGWFRDATAAAGLGSPSLPYTGFGTAWLDIDNDGWLDLVVANGAVVVEENLVAAGDEFPYHQINQLFVNRAGERFEEATARGGAAFEASHVTRGLAVGDLVGNGRVDVVLANINGPARVLENRAGRHHHWLGLRLTDAEKRRDLTQSVVWRVDGDGREIRRRSRSDGSYASANDPRVVFGLADDDSAQSVRVRWPDGTMERFDGLDADRYHTLAQGSGESEQGKDE